MSWFNILSFYVSLFIITSPLAAISGFLNLTAGQTLKEKKRVARISSLSVAFILIFSIWIGQPVLKILGISIPSFQIAGGMVILLLAFSMLQAERSKLKVGPEDQFEAEHKKSIAIVPLAIPIMAGPGAISTIIVLVTHFSGRLEQLILSFICLFIALTIWLILHFAGTLEKYLGHTGINIINRVGGLILASIAIETIVKGIEGFFPFLVSK